MTTGTRTQGDGSSTGGADQRRQPERQLSHVKGSAGTKGMTQT
jgi:hypothetical protein